MQPAREPSSPFTPKRYSWPSPPARLSPPTRSVTLQSAPFTPKRYSCAPSAASTGGRGARTSHQAGWGPHTHRTQGPEAGWLQPTPYSPTAYAYGLRGWALSNPKPSRRTWTSPRCSPRDSVTRPLGAPEPSQLMLELEHTHAPLPVRIGRCRPLTSRGARSRSRHRRYGRLHRRLLHDARSAVGLDSRGRR